jgi:stress response protein YsnF
MWRSHRRQYRDAPAYEGGISVTNDEALETILELLEERVLVERRVVQGQTVRVALTTQFRDHLVEEPLSSETVEIERIAVGRVVEATPEIRQEGDITIVPIMDEVLVLERRLVLKEEVRIRRVRTTDLHRETVQLRKQTAAVTRIDASLHRP